MAMPVGWLLTRSHLGLRAAAGRAGLDREVHWAHAIELDDPAPWLTGGELVLTTGLRLPADPEPRREYIARLDGGGAAALGFGVGLSHPAIPADLLDAAEERGLPVLEVPLATPFAAVTRAVADRLADERMREIQQTVRHQERMARAAIESGVGGVVRTLARSTGGQALVVSPGGAVLAAEPRDDPRSAGLAGRVAAELARRRPPGVRFALTADDEHGHLIVQSLAAASVRRGCLALATPRAPAPADRLLLSHAASLLALELERPRDARAVERRVRATLLRLLAEGGLDPAAVDAHVLPLGLRGDQRVAAFAGYAADARSAAAAAEEACARIGAPYLLDAADGARGADGGADRGGETVVVVPAGDAADAAREWAALVRTDAGPPPHVGIGAAAALRDVAASLRQARFALRMARDEGRPSVDFAELGVFSLLFGERAGVSAAAVAAAVLDPLVAHDGARNGELLASLDAFLRHNGTWEAAAAEVGVHRHTLRHRMRRVEELTGRRLDSARDRAEFLIALAARDVGAPPGRTGRS
ncbi:purine catabolism regulator [Murinocardiopsis flavida]|uniref:Purine catabolism regulator n=1 Tax=Murinocardiopsis flavida TaxID=645275 RepID=A0A2P8DKF2_9ACTN|nr:PucR family transcriptional regulator [Murinocardiopsis flavida]PSK97702.1 purine catabolism regulator [Murinocardiopsis flavida]